MVKHNKKTRRRKGLQKGGSSDTNKTYICLLCVKPSRSTYDFYKKLRSDKYNVVIVIDDESYEIPGYNEDTDKLQVIKIDKKESEDAGFKDCILWLRGQAGSRDKALYYFCKKGIQYENIWFIEEDVFIPDMHTLKTIDDSINVPCDLLCATNGVLTTPTTVGNWSVVSEQLKGKLELPYAHSMISAARCSKKMMDAINDYADKHKTLFLDESLFVTLALKNNLNINNPPALAGILWDKQWKLCEIEKGKLYHPIKDQATQVSYHKSLSK